MPVYEYQCKACGHEFEREQRITEDPLKDCPKCKEPRAKRMISRTSFVLKGSGWYSDLYASPAAPKAEEAAKPSEKGDSGDGGGAAKGGEGGKKSKKKDKAKSKSSGPGSGSGKGAKGKAAA